MKKQIISLLSTTIDRNLVTDLIDSYITIKEYYSFKYQETLVFSGHFCELTWKIIEFVRTGTILSKISNKTMLLEKFETDLHLSMQERIIIPRLTSAIYDIRNRKRSGHATTILPTKNDAFLVHRVCTYVLIEFLMIYSSMKIEEIKPMLENLIIRKAPIIEEIDGYFFNTKSINLADLILYIIYVHDKGSLKRSDIIALIPTYKHNTIQATISRLKKEEKIFENPLKFLFLRNKGIDRIDQKIFNLNSK